MSALALLHGVTGTHKRGHAEGDGACADSDEIQFRREVKRRRLDIYQGSLQISSFERGTFILNFGAWIAERHGFTYLHHPITGERTYVSFPSHLIPYDAIPVVYDHVTGLPSLRLPGSTEGADGKDKMEDAILCEAIGVQSQAIYVGLMATMASLLMVMDDTLSLRCQHCTKNASQCFLLTLAEEYNTECRHPIVLSAGSEIAWADADFSSRPKLAAASPLGTKSSAAAKDERVGRAICFECLYAQIMIKDEKLMEEIGLFQALMTAYYRNREWEAASETLTHQSITPRRLCACRHSTGVGMLCLFRFSRVLPPDSRVLYEQITRSVLFTDRGLKLSSTSAAASGCGDDGGGGQAYEFPLVDKAVETHLQQCTPFYKLVMEARKKPASSSSSSLRSVAPLPVPMAAPPPSPPRPLATSPPRPSPTARRLDFEEPAPTPVSPSRPMAPAMPAPSAPWRMDSSFLLGLNPQRFTLRPPTADEIATLTTAEHVDFMQHALLWVTAFYQSAERVGSQAPLPSGLLGHPTGSISSSAATAGQQQQHHQADAMLLDDDTATDSIMSRTSSKGMPRKPAPKNRRPTLAPGTMVPAISGSSGGGGGGGGGGVSGLYIGQHHVPKEMPDYCRVCGCYGHSQIKTCPFVMNDKVKARANMSISNHYAQNVPAFSTKARSALGDFTKLAMSQARELVSGSVLAKTRQTLGIGMPRGGPTADSIESTERGGTFTPSIEFTTLAAITHDDYATLLNLDFFWDEQYIRSILGHWRSQGFAVADLEDLLEWVEETKRALHDRTLSTTPFSQLHPPERQAEIRRALFNFVQERHALVQRACQRGDESRLFAQVLEWRQARATEAATAETTDALAPPLFPPTAEPEAMPTDQGEGEGFLLSLPDSPFSPFLPGLDPRQ